MLRWRMFIEFGLPGKWDIAHLIRIQTFVFSSPSICVLGRSSSLDPFECGDWMKDSVLGGLETTHDPLLHELEKRSWRRFVWLPDRPATSNVAVIPNEPVCELIPFSLCTATVKTYPGNQTSLWSSSVLAATFKPYLSSSRRAALNFTRRRCGISTRSPYRDRPTRSRRSTACQAPKDERKF